MTESDFNKVFSKNLRLYLDKNNMTQLDLAKRLNVGTTSVSNWCNGLKSPRMDKVDAMCKLFNCSRTDLMEDNTSLSTSRKRGVVVKVLGRVAAGIPIEAVEDVIDTEEITEEMAATGTYFGLQIKGDSMVPNICDHDVVIVRQQDDAETGDTVIALVNGDDATCKRLKKYHDGIELIPNNPNFEPIYFSNEEIQSKPVRIIGKVVELRRKF